MTTPRQDIPDWDSAADEQDALRSLDVTDINATLHDRVIEDPYVPAVTVPASAQTTRVVPNVPTITEPAQQVQETVSQPVLTRQRRRRRVSGEDESTLRRATPRPAPQPVPSQPYDDDFDATAARRPVRPSRPRRPSALLTLIMVVARLAAIALCVLVVLLAVPQLGARMHQSDVTSWVSSLMPGSLSGTFVFATPFGGAFRGDFAFAALALFVVDWICSLGRTARR